MRVFCCRLVFILLVFTGVVQADTTLPQVRVAVLQSGTVNWELQYIIDHQIDRQHGFEMRLQKVASLSAARLALTSGGADMIVSDWLWAGKRNNAGEQLRFIPFSSQIGSVLLPNGSSITQLSDLKGKTIGVAGGPMNKSWVLLQAAARAEGVDLQSEATVQFGAPPLLSQALKRGQVDVLATFWHYGARLEAEGYQPLVSMQQLMQQMGMNSNVPMLGYLFNAQFEVRNPAAVKGFAMAIQSGKQRLAEDPAGWESLRPLMKADNDAIFEALKAGYISGTPQPVDSQQIKDAQTFYQLIDSLEANPTGQTLDSALFYRVDA